MSLSGVVKASSYIVTYSGGDGWQMAEFISNDGISSGIVVSETKSLCHRGSIRLKTNNDAIKQRSGTW